MSCPEGYRISFWPAKAIGVPSKEVFLIPKKPEGESGVDYYYFFNAYVEAINKEIMPGNEQNFWFQGKTKNDGASMFVNQNIGIKELYNIPKYMAEICGYEEPGSYTGHTFRRTARQMAVASASSYETS